MMMILMALNEHWTENTTRWGEEREKAVDDEVYIVSWIHYFRMSSFNEFSGKKREVSFAKQKIARIAALKFDSTAKLRAAI